LMQKFNPPRILTISYDIIGPVFLV